MLAKHFMELEAQRLGRTPVGFDDNVLQAMRSYHWPGAVRQLRNVVETILILAASETDEPVGIEALPAEISGLSADAGGQTEQVMNLSLSLREARTQFERQYMIQQLQRFEGNISQMARFIGMERSALHRKLNSLDINENTTDN